MKIGMILMRPYPPDIRVDKEIRMLQEGGHQLHLLCLGRDKQGDEQRQDGVRIRYVRRRDNVLFRKFDSFCFYLTFCSRFWQSECERLVRDFSIDVLHVHDLPLVRTAHAVGLRHGIPVVADLHENYAAALQEWDAPFFRKAVLCNPGRWRNYEASILAKISQILVVVEESKEYLLEYGLPPEKITVIANVTHPDFGSRPIDETLVARYSNHFLISYIGGFGPHRGIDVAIRAMQSLKSAIPSSRLLLIGEGAKGYFRELQNLVVELGVQDVVEFIGWRPFSEVPSYIQASDVCLVPHNPGVHTSASAPHKLFQYWMMGKPVVVSSCKSLRRIVEKAQGGLVFEAGNPQDLARSLSRLYRHRDLCSTLGTNGRQAALSGDYNWEQAAIRLNRVYDQLS